MSPENVPNFKVSLLKRGARANGQRTAARDYTDCDSTCKFA
jgi:hypothetical protein